MNSRTAEMLLKADGEVPPLKKKRKRNFNPLLCSSLDNIGRHIPKDKEAEFSECKFCGMSMQGFSAIREEAS